MAWAMGEGTEHSSDVEEDRKQSAWASPRDPAMSGFLRQSSSTVHPWPPGRLTPADGCSASSSARSSTMSREVGHKPWIVGSKGGGPLGEAEIDHEMAIEDFDMPDIDETEAWALLELALRDRTAFINNAVQNRMNNLFPTAAPEGGEEGDALIPPGQQQMDVTSVVGFRDDVPRQRQRETGDDTEGFDEKAIVALEKAQERDDEEYRKQRQQWRERQLQVAGDGAGAAQQDTDRHVGAASVRFRDDPHQERQVGRPSDDAAEAGAHPPADQPSSRHPRDAPPEGPEQESCMDWLFPGHKDVQEEREEDENGIKPQPPLMAFRAVGGVQKKLLEMTPAERHRALVQLQFEVRDSTGSRSLDSSVPVGLLGFHLALLKA